MFESELKGGYVINCPLASWQSKFLRSKPKMKLSPFQTSPWKP